jgi:putative ABC transport system permease protein
MFGIWRDIQYGLRGFLKRPAFTALAVLTLALGIGASTTIFSVIQNVLLDPFPYTDASRIAMFQIHDLNRSRPGGRSAFQVPEFLTYQEETHVFDQVIGGAPEDILMMSGEGTEQFDGAFVTPNTFRFLGVPAIVGRGLQPEDGQPGAPPVFVMSHKLWQNKYNLDPTIVGRSFVLNGVATTLVGIMPARFTRFAADLWRVVPLDRGSPEASRRSFVFQGHLKPGATLKEAESELDVIARRLAIVYPKNYPSKFNVQAVSWLESSVGQFRTTLYTLAAAVGLLLLIACGNVGNMLLARAASRHREMALRASLGASRWRVIRQLLIESGLLGLGGAGAGCLFAYAGTKGLAPLMPDGVIPQEVVIHLNVRVLLFSLVLGVATAVLFGLAPVIQTLKCDVVGSLMDLSKGTTRSSHGGRFHNALVVVEVALSLTLLVGAGLMIRSFVALQRVDLGLNPDHVLLARLPFPRGQYDSAAAKQRFFEAFLQRLQALPGVVTASETSSMPPYGGIRTDIDVPGQIHSERWEAIFALCSEGYFQTLGLRINLGRAFSNLDVSDLRKVAVVNQTLVDRHFGAANPIGRYVKVSALETLPTGRVEDPTFEIVGVIADAKNQGVKDPPIPEVLIPYTIAGAYERGVLVRTTGDPDAIVNSVRRELWAVDRSMALTFAAPLTERLKQYSYASPRFSLVLVSVFAGLGLALVAIGIYSVVGYAVSQRTHEIGIRMALGATRADVLWLVGRSGCRRLIIGLVFGLLVSAWGTRIIASELWGVSPQDPTTLIGVVVVMMLAGLTACYVPARRATAVDPMIALRSE